MTGFNARIAVAGAMLAAIGIAFGAFGAHGLRAMLDAQRLGWWETGVQYQMWNAIGLVALAASRRAMGRAALAIGLGTLLFSGSLYVMALTGQSWLGMVAPVGGLAMIAGWVMAAIGFARRA